VVGHDPDKMPSLCDEHHLQRHRDLFDVREDAEVGFRFFRLDGTELTGAPGEVAPTPTSRALVESGPRSYGRAEPAGATSSAPAPAASGLRSHERTDPVTDSAAAAEHASQLEEDAGRALATLGLRPRERERAMKSAREALAARDEAVTLESLVREALVALPGQGRASRSGDRRPACCSCGARHPEHNHSPSMFFTAGQGLPADRERRHARG